MRGRRWCWRWRSESRLNGISLGVYNTSFERLTDIECIGCPSAYRVMRMNDRLLSGGVEGETDSENYQGAVNAQGS